MGDHFVLLVDRLLTESTLGAAIGDQNQLKQATALVINGANNSNTSHNNFGGMMYPRKVVECRICQDEDEDSNMEAPCSCCGSLKYAHRRCVQRWCYEKGDTVCEICHQQFKPDYQAPPQVFRFRDIPTNLRENWEISRRSLSNRHFIAMVSTDRNFMDPHYDEYAASTARSLVCCRLVAIIFMLLLILRHTLPLIIDGTDEYSFPLSTVIVLRTAGIILPIYLIFTAFTAMLQRRRRQELRVVSPTSSAEDIQQPALQQQPPIIHV